MTQVNVLQLIDSLHIGGAEVLAVNMNNLLNERNDINSYLCATREEGTLKQRIQNTNSYLFLNKKRSLDLLALLRLKRFIRINNISVIHAHSSSYFMAVCLKLITAKIKIIWHDHYGLSDFLENRKIQPLRFFSYFFSFGIFVNENLLNWSKINLKIKQFQVINNFAYLDNSDKKTVLFGESRKRIVCVGAFRPQKDHLNLLNAFLDILKTHPDWTLHLIGRENNSDYFKSIKNFIVEKKIERSVFFYGACDDLKFIYSQASIGVISSKSEGLPISLLEFGLSKLPVVVTDVGDCREVIKDNGGTLVTKESPKDLAKAIRELIDSKEKRIKFGQNLYITVTRKYSAAEYIKKITSIYKELV